MDNFTLWVVAGYLVVVITVGLVLKARKAGVRDFFVADASLPWFLLVPFLMGEFIHSTATVGTAEMAHELGVVAIWYFVGAPIGLTILAYGLVKFYVSLKGITIGEVFAVLFDQKNRLVFVCFLLISTGMTLGASCLGLGTIIGPVLNVSYVTGVWISAVIVIVLASFGLRGIAAMNMVHIFTIIISFIVIAFTSLNLAGGPSQLIASLPDDHLDFNRLGWPTLTAWVVSSTFMKFVSAIAVTGMFAAKNEKTAKTAALVTGFFVLAFAVLPTIVGLSAYVLMPDIDSRLALWKMGEQSGILVSALVSVGVLAAVISTTPGLLLSLTGIATRDLFLTVFPQASEKAQMTFSMFMIPTVAIAATAFALTQPSILGLIIKVTQVRVIFAIILILSIMWRRIHADAALMTSVTGAGTALAWFLAGSPWGVEPLWPGLGLGIMVLILTSTFKKPSPYRGMEGLGDAAMAENPEPSKKAAENT
jgi:SSS family solute:Na+ symporter